MPRGWFWVTAAQFIALNGVIMILAGAAIGLVWDHLKGRDDQSGPTTTDIA